MLKTILKKKKQKKKENWTDRTLGQMVKANVYRQNHTKKNTQTYTLTKREKGKKKKYIYMKKRKRATKSINKSTNDNKL